MEFKLVKVSDAGYRSPEGSHYYGVSLDVVMPEGYLGAAGQFDVELDLPDGLNMTLKDFERLAIEKVRSLI